jgi:uncharacterized protein with WD repeat
MMMAPKSKLIILVFDNISGDVLVIDMKQKINKILVALDGSNRSFRGLSEAIYLERQRGMTIT